MHYKISAILYSTREEAERIAEVLKKHGLTKKTDAVFKSITAHDCFIARFHFPPALCYVPKEGVEMYEIYPSPMPVTSDTLVNILAAQTELNHTIRIEVFEYA